VLHRIANALLILSLMAAAEPLRSLAEIRALPSEQAARQLPVEVEGTVVYFDANAENYGEPQGLILHDGTAGCYASSPVPFKEHERIRPGTRIRVKGITNPKSYFPNIRQAEVEVLGQGALPEPRRISGRDLFSRSVDAEWVEVGAVVVGVEPRGLSFTVVVEIDGRNFKAEVPKTEDAPQRVATLMQRRVRLQGVVGTITNDLQQLTDRHFFVPSFDQFIPVEDAIKLVDAPLRSIGSLLLGDHDIDDPVRVRGVVTQTDSGGFYLRDDTGSTHVQAAESFRYQAGDQVEVEGFAALAPFRPVLRASRIVQLGKTTLAAPVNLKPHHGVAIELHDERVVVDCVFFALRQGLHNTVLQCRQGESLFEAWLPDHYDLKLRSGDQLRLTGIYEVTTSRPMPRIEWADGFRLNLPDSNAIRIVATAPWWTLERMFLALGLVLFGLCIVFVWGWQLRKKVAAQSSIIARQMQQGVIKDERARIARELHDSLEQDLTGLSMQLGNLAPALNGDRTLAHNLLAIARGMLQHCRFEARATVSDLRNPHLIERSLPDAMRESLPPVAGADVKFVFELIGTPQPLRATTQNHLLRIAREAVFNAARHADPDTIHVRLSYHADGVTLEIIDDGGGFDATGKPPAGHFGLLGMRERANKIHADFSIDSTPGNGTSVCVKLLSPSPALQPRS
jgi:signal transduction histidine kinase